MLFNKEKKQPPPVAQKEKEKEAEPETGDVEGVTHEWESKKGLKYYLLKFHGMGWNEIKWVSTPSLALHYHLKIKDIPIIELPRKVKKPPTPDKKK